MHILATHGYVKAAVEPCILKDSSIVRKLANKGPFPNRCTGSEENQIQMGIIEDSSCTVNVGDYFSTLMTKP